MKKPFVLLCVTVLLPGLLSAQLILKLTTLPASTPAGAEFFLAGSFNNWQAGSPAARFTPDTSGSYQIELDIPPGTVEYKITRGSWQTVEGDGSGKYRPNRRAEYRGGRQVETFSVLTWEDLDGQGGARSTAAPNVRLLSADFYMPQLNRTRRIWIYLPPDYNQSTRRYPVLYMQDGQNLFDAGTSFSGEWQVDETLNGLFGYGDPGVIVIGVDNGGAYRIDEYSPWTNGRYGGGEGAAYAAFIVETLKPYIDREFRTLPGRENTGIMGSSIGGLLALFAAVEHQDVFGKAGILSPSLWFSEEAYIHVVRTGKQYPVQFYLMAGRQEDSGVVEDLVALGNTLLMTGFDRQQIVLAIHGDGQHNEWYWAREFRWIYQWLYRNRPSPGAPETAAMKADISLNTRGKGKRLKVLINAPAETSPLRLRILRLSGEEAVTLEAKNGRNRLPTPLPPGGYVAFLYNGDQLLVASGVKVQ